MRNATAKEQRIIADFNRGKLSAKQATKMLKKLAARKGRNARRNYK